MIIKFLKMMTEFGNATAPDAPALFAPPIPSLGAEFDAVPPPPDEAPLLPRTLPAPASLVSSGSSSRMLRRPSQETSPIAIQSKNALRGMLSFTSVTVPHTA
jgi:hypothetical protein